MNHNTLKHYIFFSAIFLFGMLLLIVGLQKHTSVSFATDLTVTYNEDWTQVSGDAAAQAVSFPGEIAYADDGTITLQHKLPEHIKSGLTICFWTQAQTIQAIVDDEEIYSCGLDDNYIFGKNSGSYWNMIRIPESAKGKVLTVVLTSAYNDQSFYMDTVYIGTEASLLFTLMQHYGIGVVLALLLLVTGIVTGAIYLVFRKSLDANRMQQVLYLCLFTVLLSVWMFAQSRCGQFLCGNSFVLLLLEYMGMMLLPIPMLFLIAQIKDNHARRLLILLAYVMIVNFFVCTVLQFANIKDFAQTKWVTYLLLGIVLVVVLLNAVFEQLRYHNRNFRCTAVGIYLLVLFVGIEIAFAIIQENYFDDNFIRLGALCFVCALVYEAVYEAVKAADASKSAAYYERLAMVDIMANCYSRTAYNKDVELLSKRRKFDGLCVIFFDLNNLKKINDNYGHKYGDAAIKTCARCIRKVFDAVGKAYRLGGDEFAVIVDNCDESKLVQRLALFQKLVKEQDKHFEFGFQVACGYAVFDTNQDTDIDSLVHRADAAMYERKRSMKVKNVNV